MEFQLLEQWVCPCGEVFNFLSKGNFTLTCFTHHMAAVIDGVLMSTDRDEVIAYGTWGERFNWPVDWKERIVRE